MSLGDAKQIRTAPFAVNRLDVRRTHDGIEFAGNKKYSLRGTERLVMQG